MYYFTPHSSMFGTNYVPPHLERFVTSTHDFRCRYSEREVISVPHKKKKLYNRQFSKVFNYLSDAAERDFPTLKLHVCQRIESL